MNEIILQFIVVMLLATPFLGSSCTFGHAYEAEYKYDVYSLTIDEKTPLGFSVSDLIEKIGTEQDAVFRWHDKRYTGNEVNSNLNFEIKGDIKYYDYETDDGIHEDCSSAGFLEFSHTPLDVCDSVRFDVMLHFITEDGSFDEIFTMSAMTNNAYTIALSSKELIDFNDINGSYEVPDEYTSSEYKSTEAVIYNMIWSDATVAGLFMGNANYKPESNGDIHTSDSWVIGSWNMDPDDL